MKKLLTLFLAVTLILTLAACGGSTGSSTSVSFATGGTSGTYYGFCGIIGQVLNERSAI